MFLPSCFLLVASFLLAVSNTLAENGPLRLQTADTILTLNAGAERPSLLTLASDSGAAWKSQQPQALIERARINGEWEPVHWTLQAVNQGDGGNRATVVYSSSKPRLRLHWNWQARARRGPLEHSIRIENLESQAVELPLQNSLTFDFSVKSLERLRHMWIEKGAGTPSAEGTHEVAVTNPYHWQATSSTYAHDRPGEPREPIPWLLVETTEGQRSGWYVGIEFSGLTRLSLSREGGSLSGEAGLDPAPGLFLTRVPAGGSFSTPTVFLGAFSGGSDSAGNILRRWVSQVLLNPANLRNPSYPLLVSNTWGNGMEINEEKARGLIRDAAALGLEMFHVDAGWFRGVGDWYAHPQKFPSGMGALAGYAHHRGLQFGLWVDWTQAGTDAAPEALSVHDPKVGDWLTRDVPAGWKPEPFKGVTIDIGYPPARAWCARELDRLVRDYQLDMLEHDGYLVAQGCVRNDHPHVSCKNSPLGPEPWLEGSCSTDVSYHATRSYYALYDQLRRKYPRLLLEACNDGGRMVDFGTAAHTDYFSITDTYDPLSNRRAFYDASHVLPAAMLECYVARYPSQHPANFICMLRSGMMGWCTIMQDTTVWTAEQRAAARHAFQLYKTRLRPLIRFADLYHISPRPDGVGWDGIEYFSPDTGEGVVYAFRGSTLHESDHTYTLRGLRPERQYALHFEDHTSADRKSSGKELMSSGLSVSLPLPDSSELVFIKEIGLR